MTQWPTLNYAQRDPAQVLAELQQQIPTLNPNWTAFLDSDIGYALLKSLVALNDFNAFFVDANTAETFLSLCTFRESAIRSAKMLDYPVYRATPATVPVMLTFPAFSFELSIPALTQWTINGIPFTCLDAILINPGQTQTVISLTQGTPYSATITSPGTAWYKIVIPVNAAEIAVSVNTVTWAATDSWIGITNPQTYKIYEDTGGQTICFGANLNAYIPPVGSTIQISAILTMGAAGNIQASGLNAIPVSSITNPQSGAQINNVFTAVTTAAVLGGEDVESIESIKANAPGIYGTQGRAVTAADWEAIVLNVDGVTDCSVIGGENLGFYSYVYITVYGDDPYTVSPDLITALETATENVSILCITPKFQAPTVIEMQLTCTLGISQNAYANAQAAINAATTAVNTFVSNLRLGTPMYNSALLATIMGVPGISYADVSFTVDSFATSVSGKIAIPICANADLTNCTLKNAAGSVLFTGNGTSYVSNGLFTYLEASDFENQICTLYYTTTTSDLVLETAQVIVLTNLSMSATFVNPGSG